MSECGCDTCTTDLGVYILQQFGDCCAGEPVEICVTWDDDPFELVEGDPVFGRPAWSLEAGHITYDLYWNGSQWQWDIFGTDFGFTTNAPNRPWDVGADWDALGTIEISDEPCP